jgi:uncharacterized protein YcaQ
VPGAVIVSADEAARALVGHHGLGRWQGARGAAGVRALLGERRCVQLDPLDRIGTNADLVAMARVEGLRKGEVYTHLLPGHAFEHFAKERCLLPASAFPYYRGHAVQTPWWRANERQQRLLASLLDEVLAEFTERGALTLAELSDRGRVEPIDWSGWKGTGKASTMAVEVLWRRCDLVVTERVGRHKRFDLPSRALPEVASLPAAGPFDRWALVERVEAAGLLARVDGPWWSTLSGLRTTALIDELVEQGVFVEVQLAGSARRYLAPPSLFEQAWPEPDAQMRVLGPLDSLVWDRKLVEHAFGFSYLWEVYKPAAKRQWGWYVCPLLHRGRFVGRVEARVEGGRVVVDRLWREAPDFDEAAWQELLSRHERAICGPTSG